MEIFSMKRMYNIFRNDNRSLIVAMDHGSAMNVFPDLIETKKVLEEIVDNGADALLTTFGIVKNFWNTLKGTGIILRIDGGVSLLRAGSKQYNQLFSIEDALRIGADAVGCMGLPGTDDESNTLNYLSQISANAYKWNVPVLAEMLPGGFNKDLHSPENIALAARIGVELGADMIKTAYPKNMDKFKETVRGVYKPIVVLGGNKSGDAEELLKMVRDALDCGASGVAIGRNIWGHSQPGKMTAALSAIIHENYTVKQALELLK
ncbi:MAG: class I fructose-bisphosphate aldolase [Petrotogales bacterium]